MIKDKELREKIRQLIAESMHIKIEKITEGVSITQELGVDSLDIIQMLAAVEKQYHIEIPEEELPNMENLEGVIKVVKRYSEKKKQATES